MIYTFDDMTNGETVVYNVLRDTANKAGYSYVGNRYIKEHSNYKWNTSISRVIASLQRKGYVSVYIDWHARVKGVECGVMRQIKVYDEKQTNNVIELEVKTMEKNWLEGNHDDDTLNQKRLIHNGRMCGISSDVIKQYWHYGVERVERAIQRVRTATPRNPIAYFVDAVRKGYCASDKFKKAKEAIYKTRKVADVGVNPIDGYNADYEERQKVDATKTESYGWLRPELQAKVNASQARANEKKQAQVEANKKRFGMVSGMSSTGDILHGLGLA